MIINLLRPSPSTPSARAPRKVEGFLPIILSLLPESHPQCSVWVGGWKEVKFKLYFPGSLSSNSPLSSDFREW